LAGEGERSAEDRCGSCAKGDDCGGGSGTGPTTSSGTGADGTASPSCVGTRLVLETVARPGPLRGSILRTSWAQPGREPFAITPPAKAAPNSTITRSAFCKGAASLLSLEAPIGARDCVPRRIPCDGAGISPELDDLGKPRTALRHAPGSSGRLASNPQACPIRHGSWCCTGSLLRNSDPPILGAGICFRDTDSLLG
jgi:hypothetical protein